MAQTTELTSEQYAARREQALAALSGDNTSRADIVETQKNLVEQGLYPKNWVDGIAGEITKFATQAAQDPYFARKHIDDMLRRTEEVSDPKALANDIRKTQISLKALGVYDGEITGKMDRATGNGILATFDSSVAIQGGEIGKPALSLLNNHVDDQARIQTLRENPYIRIQSTTNFQEDADKPYTPDVVANHKMLSKEFWKAGGLYDSKVPLTAEFDASAERAMIASRYGADLAGIDEVLTKDGALTKEDIEKLQVNLNASGLNVGNADGIIGPQTATGMLQYLDRHPEKIGSIGTDALGQIIKHADKDMAKAVFSSAPEFEERLVLDLQRYETQQFDRNEIKDLQTRLKVLGHYDMEIDGFAGGGTRKAIAGFHEAFQAGRENGFVPFTPKPGEILARFDEQQNPAPAAAPRAHVESKPLDNPVTAPAAFQPGMS